MKPKLIKIFKPPSFSFSIRQDCQPGINNRWHFHQEVELIHLHRGSGIHFVGDSIKRFGNDEILLIGSKVPHYFKYDKNIPQQDADSPDPYSTVVHFCDDFWSKGFLDLPENRIIKQTLIKAEQGITTSAKNEPIISGLIKQILTAKEHYRIVLLIEILALIGESKNTNTLASIGFNSNLREADNYRMNIIFDYIYANFRENILLKDAAENVSLSPNSFCRYFKEKTGKTFFQFINEVKINHACKLLTEHKISIKEVCYDSGFNNFPSFHTVFKQIKGMTPLTYRNYFKCDN